MYSLPRLYIDGWNRLFCVARYGRSSVPQAFRYKVNVESSVAPLTGPHGQPLEAAAQTAGR